MQILISEIAGNASRWSLHYSAKIIPPNYRLYRALTEQNIMQHQPKLCRSSIWVEELFEQAGIAP